MSEDRCIICGEIIPEGRQVCPICEKEKLMKCNHFKEYPDCSFHYNGLCLRDHIYECPPLMNMKNLSHGEMVQIVEGKKNKTPRYIDANRLIDMATHEGAYGYVDVHDIDNTPTADVVAVVRCRGCSHSQYDEEHDWYVCYGSFCTIHDGDFYCAAGDPKEKANDNQN